MPLNYLTFRELFLINDKGTKTNKQGILKYPGVTFREVVPWFGVRRIFSARDFSALS